ncbi:Interferon alpha-inducible protein 27, mitochondrial [Myotis davidii]|uniref:Interferon alpha-inducible protein 27, mitochondrial n=1 Tax=Myotis davidii TaxID=225400 RepID=L5LLJ5_MYODS|nr:Interferon alpha-inducible protein 27, mitochondrial [Myotis davidii]
MTGDLKEPVPWGPPQTLLPAVVAVGAVPVVLGAMGFTSAGIAASSIAAKMMSSAAIANGGGVAAGGLVATLQSVGRCPEQE